MEPARNSRKSSNSVSESGRNYHENPTPHPETRKLGNSEATLEKNAWKHSSKLKRNQTSMFFSCSS
jgi:hypothetical protein